MNALIKIITWIFSITFLLFGLVGLFNDPQAGLFLALIGLFFLPPVDAALNRLGLKLTWWMKWVIFSVLLITFSIVAKPS